MIRFWNDKVRPVLDKHPAIVLGLLGVAAIAAMAFGIRSWTNGGSSIATPSTYYTTDDGKTLFEDNEPHVPPFDHDGHEAVRAYIIPGRSPGPDSVWYLSKMSDEQKKQLESMSTGGPFVLKAGAAKPPSPFGGQLIKRPGDAEWVPMGDAKAAEIMRTKGE